MSTTKWRMLRHAGTGKVLLKRVRLCDTFWTRFRGLQFVSHLPSDEGLLFVTNSESRSNTSIHMFFMAFPIAVVWLDKSGKVVAINLAR